MKNIKSFIAKNVSVFLSLAIILTTLLPVFSGVAKAATYDSAKITELKEAWGALTVKETLVPTEVWAGSNVVGTGLTLSDTSSYSGPAISDTSKLGPKYATYTTTGVATGCADNKDMYVFRMMDNDANYTIGQFVSYSYEFNSTAETLSRVFMHYFNTGVQAERTLYAGTFLHNPMAAGWSTISYNGVNARGEYASNLSDKFLGLGFDLNGAAADITVGSMTGVFKAASDETLALADSDADAFVTAAVAYYEAAVTGNKFEITDAAFLRFKAAIDAILNDNSNESEMSVAIKNLKNAWKALTHIGYDDTVAMNYIGSNGTGSNYAVNDTSKLGPKYATYTTSGTNSGAADNKDMYVFRMMDGDVNYTIGQFVSYSYEFHSTAAMASRVYMHYFNTNAQGERTLYAGSFLHSPMAEGWSTISYNGVNARSEYASNLNDEFLGIGFDLNGAAGTITVGSMTGVFKAASAETLALADSDATAFIAAATEYYNAAVAANKFDSADAAFIAFANAVNAADASNVADLKAAWAALTVNETLIPSVLWNGANTVGTGLTLKDTSQYDGPFLGECPPQAPEASEIRKMTINTTSIPAYFTEVSNFATEATTTVPFKQITDMYFYYKSDADIKALFGCIGNNGSARHNRMFGAGSTWTLPNTNGQWVKLSFFDWFTSNGFSFDAIVKNAGETAASTQLAIIGFQSLYTASGTTDLYVSELFVDNGVDENLAGSENWTDVEWMTNAINANPDELKNDYVDGVNNTEKWASFVAAREALYAFADELAIIVATNNFKTAWQALTPSETAGDKVDATLLNHAAIGAGNLSNDVPADVGANANSVVMPIGTKATQMLQFGDEVANNLVTPASRTDIDDIYFYYKSTSDVYLRVSISYSDGSSATLKGAAAPFSGLFKAASSNGQWVKVSIPDFINGAAAGAWANRYKPADLAYAYYSKVRVEFATTNAIDANNGTENVADVYVSNLFFKYDTNLYGSEDWTDEQWCEKAITLNVDDIKNDYVDGVNNTEKWTAFVEARNTLVDCLPDQNVVALKEIWGSLKIKATMIPSEIWAGFNTLATGFTVNDSANYNGPAIPDASKLGPNYTTFTTTGTGGAADNVDMIVFKPSISGLKLSQFESYSFEYHTTAANASRVYMCIVNSSGSLGTIYAPSYLHNPMPQGWSTVSYEGVNERSEYANDLDREVLGIGFDLTAVPADITVGSMTAIFTAANESDLALADTDEEAFVEAAKRFYVKALANNYFASDDAAFASFTEVLGNLTDLSVNDVVSSEVAVAWDALNIEKTLIPYEVWEKDGVVGTGLNVYDSSAYSGSDLADKSVLGPKYATFSATKSSSASDNVDYIVYKFADGNEALTVGQLDTISLYVNSSAAIGGIRPKMHINGGIAVDNPTFFTAAQIGSGSWKNVSLRGLSSKEGYQSVKQRIMTGVGLDIAGNADIQVGSITATFKTLSAENKALSATNSLEFLAEAIKFNKTADSIFGENNAKLINFREKLNAALTLITEEDKAIVELIAGWKSLSSTDSYPDSDTTEWNLADWVYAAQKVDTANLTNTEEFVEALVNAINLRDELGIVLSCDITSFTDAASAQGTIDSLGENVLVGKVPSVYYFDGTEKTEISVANAENLTDGNFDTVEAFANYDFSAPNSYAELVYEFNGEAVIDDFIVGFNNNADHANMNYKIYAANNMADLFLDKSLVAAYNNELGEQVQRFSYGGKIQITGAYIAFRFYGNESGLTISELGAYGEVVTYSVKTNALSDAEMKALGTNLFANAQCYIRGGTGGRVKWEEHQQGSLYPYTKLVDLSNETGCGFAAVTGSAISKVDQDITMHLVFDLKDTYYVEKILFNHFRQNYLQTGKYEIYASTEMGLLFKDSSKIITYNNMSDGPNGTTNSQLFTMAGNGIIARYISICVKCPVSDYENALATFSGMCYPRINDLAAFGTKYVKPKAEINFVNHVPVEVYRTDSAGNKTTVKEDEYSGDDYLYAYDGKYDVATPIAQNDKYVDFVFNLCANKTINSVKLSTLTENIKGLKVYASDSAEGVWNNDSMVVEYYGEAVNEVFRTFGETPIEARYVRFCITETASGTFDPTEFEVIGWNTQEFAYYNLAESKQDDASMILVDKDTGEYTMSTQNFGRYYPHWWGQPWYEFYNMFDGDEDTVADFYTGSMGNPDGTGKKTINFLVDLGTLNAVDNIELIAGSNKEFWPNKVNFYLGDDDLALFDADLEPDASFNEKSNEDSGSYEYNFLPKVVQYVRVEIVDATNDLFNTDNKMATIIADIKVNGLEILASTASEGVAASVTDEETGIRVDLVALRENDVYTTLQDILVVKREATAEEKAATLANNNKFASDVYQIFLLDVNGDLIEDVDGRDIKIYLPKSLYKGTSEEAFVMSNELGEFSIIDFTTEDDYFVVVSSDPLVNNYAFCEFVSVDVEEDEDDNDTPTDTDNTVEEDETETEDEEPEEEEEETSKKKRKVKVVRKGNGTDIFDYLWIIIVVVAVVIVAAGITLFIILAKKKKKQEEEA